MTKTKYILEKYCSGCIKMELKELNPIDNISRVFTCEHLYKGKNGYFCALCNTEGRKNG